MSKSSKRRYRTTRQLYKDQLIDRHNKCGVYDPTPYEAVKRIIREEQKQARGVTTDDRAKLQDAHGRSTEKAFTKSERGANGQWGGHEGAKAGSWCDARKDQGGTEQ